MSKKDIVNMIVETYSAQSKADKEFLDLHAPIITTHYSPQYPDMDDILTARHFNTYVRREHGRNHPVAGEAFSKANQTRNAMYNQDHGYMPDEDSNYSFPHPNPLSEEDDNDSNRSLNESKIGDIWKAGKTTAGKIASKVKETSKLYSAARKRNQENRDAKKVNRGQMSADEAWKKHGDGTYHAADGNHYDYKRTVSRTKNADGSTSEQHQLHIRKRGSKSNAHETVHINKDWSNEQGMRHHKGPSHIEHLYSQENKPKVEMNEMVMISPHPFHDHMLDNFPHMDPFKRKDADPFRRKSPSIKKPILSPDVENVVKAVAHHLKTDHKIVTETMIQKPNVSGSPAPKQPSALKGPKDNIKKPWKPNPNSHMTDMSGSNNKQPMSEERFVIKYVLKNTLEEGVTKPWNDPEKAVAHAHKMMASQLYEAVEVVDESVWRHVGAVAGAVAGGLGGYPVGTAVGGAIGTAVAGPIGGIAGTATGAFVGPAVGFVKGGQAGYNLGLKRDVMNAKNKYERSVSRFGNNHDKTKKRKQHFDNLASQYNINEENE